jgi:hypothetical protein
MGFHAFFGNDADTKLAKALSAQRHDKVDHLNGLDTRQAGKELDKSTI